MTSVGGIAEELLGRRIHRLDRPVLVDRQDRIDGRVQNGAGPSFAVLQFADRRRSGR